MPTATYTPLATVTLGTTATSVTFSNIPATYRDLILVAFVKTASVTDNYFRLNADSGSNYSSVVMFGTGSSTGSNADTGSNASFYSYSNSTDFETATLQIMDYSATDKHKTALNRNGTSSQALGARAIRWASTSAVTSLTLYGGTMGSVNLQSGSTFSLYGVIA
jgi:hypothetical protein